MANIVLKNRSNEEQTYEGVEAVVLNTDTGETATFVGESLIPEPYVHPDTHPASMITGLANVATSGDYNQLVNKPCYQSPRLESSSLTFSPNEDLGDYAVTVEGFFQLETGDSYTVTWDGTEYPCTVKDPNDQGYGMDARYLGNLQRFWNTGLGEDTGEPFVLAISGGDYTKLLIETNQAGDHTVALTPAKSTHPLDMDFLPEGVATESWVKTQTSGLATETWVKAQIAASGGGGGSGGGSGEIPERVIFSGEITTEEQDDNLAFLTEEAQLKLASWLLGGGAESYTVIFDGETYTLTPVTLAEIGGVYIGNAGLEELGEDTGEPFLIVGVQMDGIPVGMVLTSEGGTHTLTVSVPITAENNYVPTFDFTGLDPVAVGGSLQGESLADYSPYALPWMVYSPQILVKFNLKLSDTVTYLTTVRISDTVTVADTGAMAVVWAVLGEALVLVMFTVTPENGITLVVSKLN